jgi:hypothetical protein
MPTWSVPRSLADLLAGVRPCFTAPTFRVFQAMVCGLVAQPGLRTITGMLVGARLAGVWHHARGYRLFAAACWSADQLGLAVCDLIVGTQPGPQGRGAHRAVRAAVREPGRGLVRPARPAHPRRGRPPCPGALVSPQAHRVVRRHARRPAPDDHRRPISASSPGRAHPRRNPPSPASLGCRSSMRCETGDGKDGVAGSIPAEGSTYAPLGGVVRPRRKVRFARLIDRRDRALGGPTVRAAFGGNLSLTWLPRRVVRSEWRARQTMDEAICARSVIAPNPTFPSIAARCMPCLSWAGRSSRPRRGSERPACTDPAKQTPVTNDPANSPVSCASPADPTSVQRRKTGWASQIRTDVHWQ